MFLRWGGIHETVIFIWVWGAGGGGDAALSGEFFDDVESFVFPAG